MTNTYYFDSSNRTEAIRTWAAVAFPVEGNDTTGSERAPGPDDTIGSTVRKHRPNNPNNPSN